MEDFVLLFNIRNAACHYSAAESFVSPTCSFITTAVKEEMSPCVSDWNLSFTYGRTDAQIKSTSDAYTREGPYI